MTVLVAAARPRLRGETTIRVVARNTVAVRLVVRLPAAFFAGALFLAGAFFRPGADFLLPVAIPTFRFATFFLAFLVFAVFFAMGFPPKLALMPGTHAGRIGILDGRHRRFPRI